MLDDKLTDEPGRIAALRRYAAIGSFDDPALDKITALVASLLDVPICGVSLIDQNRQHFASIQGHEMFQTARDVAFCDHTIRTRSPLVIEDARDDPRFAANPLVTGAPHIRSYAGAPLVTPDGYQLGALCAMDQRARQLDSGHLELLTRFAELVVDQLELQTLAHKDFLTGALTRRAFTELARVTLRSLERSGQGAALVCIDIDHFKSINDDYGHAVGDEVLRDVTRTCTAALRPSDSFGRLGGEEFAVLLPGGDEDLALACAERLRMAISTMASGGRRPITASFGVAVTASEIGLAQCLQQADSALFDAKRGGRNRVMPERSQRIAA